MRDLIIRPGDTINLGRQGENIAEQVQFDVAGWSDLYGAGTYSLRVLRPGESIPYEAEVSTSGERVLWNVTETDTAIRGMGEAQLILSVGDIVAKTQIYHTMITPSIGADPEPPSQEQAWFDQLKGFADAAEESAQDAEAWAVGERGGQAVPQSDETYRNNAKFYAGQADTAKQSAEYFEGRAAQNAEYAYNIQMSVEQTAQDVLLYKGAPLVAATAAAMTDHNRVYVYVGSETGYTAGNWYYWSGSAWTSGGVYNAVAIQTDTSLSVSGVAADAAAVGAVSGAKQITGWSANHLYIKNNDDTITPNSPTTTTSNVRYLITPVIPGEIYTITATGGTASRAYCFADALNNVIERAASGLAMVNVYLIVPENAAYLVVNDTTLSGTVYLGAAPGALAVSDRKDIEAIVTSTGRAAAETLGVEWIVFRRGTYRNALQSWGEKVNIAIPYNDPRFYCAMCECVPGDKITINIKGGSGYNAAWAFLNEARDVIQRTSSPVDGVKMETLTAPQNAAYLVMNCDATYKGFYAYKGSKIDPIAKDIDQLKGGAFSWAGKTVAIIGDSISTNGNYGPTNPLANVPEIVIGDEDIGVQLSAYVTYLDVGTTVGGHTITEDEIGTEITFTPVDGDQGKVVGKPDNYNASSTYVWWEVAMDTLGFTPIPVSWSGSSVTSHEADKNSYKTAHAWHPAQIRKCGIRTPGTMTRTAPDVIIIYRGTNDFSHSPRTKLTMGYFESNIQGYPTTDFIDGSYYGYIEGLMMTVGALRQAYPSARIVLCTLNVFKRATHSSFPTRQTQAQGGQTLPMYNNAIRAAADYLGCGLIEFDRDGITFENLYVDGYVTDDPDTPTHPSNKGHKVMGNRAIMDLLRLNAME